MQVKRSHFLSPIPILLLFVTLAHSYAFPYKVKRVIDGDTVELTTGEGSAQIHRY